MDEAQSYQRFIIVWDNVGFRTVPCDGVSVAREWHTDIVFGTLRRQPRNTADSCSGTHDRGQCTYSGWYNMLIVLMM